MSAQVDLVWLGDLGSSPDWPLGEVFSTEPTPQAVAQCVGERLEDSRATAWLFWDATLGCPDPQSVQKALTGSGELWHAGLCLGMGGLPHIFDSLSPTWMLNCDPSPGIEATSWRLSLRACLVQTDVLRQMGGPSPDFLTLAGASLEFGHRCVVRGVITRHLPWLLPDLLPIQPEQLPLEDEVRFAYYQSGRLWARWALLRVVLTRRVSFQIAWKAWRRACSSTGPTEPAPYTRPAPLAHPSLPSGSVTVLIPTLDRYPYLRTLLAQLRDQTVPPLEIIVIDQTEPELRDLQLADDFRDLPLHVIYQSEPGQCSSRNAGLLSSRGGYILFVDDDDEVQPDLIERHLSTLERFGADVSSGVTDEVGAGPLPEVFTYTRASNVFPTCNTLASRAALQRSGLFDLAYNRGARADHDVGMRIYLSGAVMVLNPEIRVLHHHAPRGGLRTHGARVITYASSRDRLRHRQIPSVTEIYLWMRYFSPQQVQEALIISMIGTFSLRGSRLRKILKLLIGLAYLPATWRRIRENRRIAAGMLRSFPQIESLERGAEPLASASDADASMVGVSPQ